MGPSKQLRDMVLDIVKKNKDIGFDDIVVQMKKMVGIRGDSLIKLVDEILKWWEEGGKILQMVDKKSKMGMYRVNENTQVAKDIVSEALGELGIFETPEESLTESDTITEARGYRKVKDLDKNKTLWELRTLYGMSYLVVSYSPHVDETAVFKADKNGKILSFNEVFSTGGRLDPEPIIRDIANGKIKPMDEDVMEGAKEIHKKLLQKGVVAPIDKERHPKRKGLEGPFRHKKTNKIYYYDPKEGKYYDADSDIYLDVEDVMEETLDENRRLERFIQTFYKIHPKINLHGMSKDELEKIADKAMKQGDGGSKSLVLLKTFLKKAGATEMFGESIDESVVAKKSEKFKAGIPKWFHTAFTGMPKYPTQLIAGWKTELKTGSGMPGYMTYVLHYDGVGTYTVYRGDGYKVKIRGDKPLGKFRSPEEAMDFVQKEVMNENTEVRGSFQHIKKILGN